MRLEVVLFATVTIHFETANIIVFAQPQGSYKGALSNYFLKISVIMTLSLGPPPPLLLASWQK